MWGSDDCDHGRQVWNRESCPIATNIRHATSSNFPAEHFRGITTHHLPHQDGRESCLFIHLAVADSANLPSGWSSYAQFGLTVIDQIDRKSSITKVSTKVHQFDAKDLLFRFPCLSRSEFHDPKRGYLINDACLLEVFVSTNRTEGLISRDLMLQTEEDMNTFFTSLEDEFLTSSFVFSREDVKEAPAKVDEALNMTPVDFYNSGKFYALKHAFNIIGSSIPIENEQRNELLVMEERLKELADRAAKVVRDKDDLNENQSMKLTITRNLIRYKEVDSEVKRVEQKLAALLLERKEVFRSSKEMKMELEEYEAKAKVAEEEEEEKTVEAEWARLKVLISSIKEKI